MRPAHQDEVAELRLATVGPVHDVMRVAPTEASTSWVFDEPQIFGPQLIERGADRTRGVMGPTG